MGTNSLLVPNFVDGMGVKGTAIQKYDDQDRDDDKGVTRLKVKNLGTVLK